MSRAGRNLVLLVCAVGASLGCARDKAPASSELAAVSATPESLATTPAPSADEALARMQGRWRSTDDAKVVLEIAGDRVTSRYDGEVVDVSTIAFVASCPRPSGGNGHYFTLRDGVGDELCYHLTVVDDQLLEYSYVVRGSSLGYRRIER